MTPSKVTDMSIRNTKVILLIDDSKGWSTPPRNLRRPGRPKRQYPKRPHVAHSTENISPRSSHTSAPKSSPPRALINA